MSSQIHQLSGLKFTKSSPLAPEDAAAHARNVSTSLENMLEHLEPKQSSDNEKAKDAYEECLQLQEYLSSQLQTLTGSNCADDIQGSLDILTRAIVSYEMVHAAAEGDWEAIDMSIPSL
ncbi:hypothetical protein BCR42DRAFT_414366 [Absidia repens]|uniref:Uncharacterized protein n=1 Tax=Absidia repens TaxID=90262 RepID=A0A1X2IKH8_9FUNG|nr:hypothetical protein BCR42DRAFT_414366 [Absidia repens]